MSEDGGSRAERRRQRRGGNYLKKTVTVEDQQKLLTAYHERLVEPRLQYLEERAFYEKMWPHQKAYCHWLTLKGWVKARYLAVERGLYARRWNKKNDAALDDMEASNDG